MKIIDQQGMKMLKYNVYQIWWGTLGTGAEGFGHSSKNCVRIECHLCTDSCRHKATRMNGLFRGEYSTPGSICYTEPSSLLFQAHHKLQALVDWGCNPGAPLGPLASFSKVQAFLTDKVIRSLFSVLGLGSLWNIFARVAGPPVCAVSCGYSPAWPVIPDLEQWCTC